MMTLAPMQTLRNVSKIPAVCIALLLFYVCVSSSNSTSAISSRSASSSPAWCWGGDMCDCTSPGGSSSRKSSKVMDDQGAMISEASNSSVRCPGSVVSAAEADVSGANSNTGQ